jgi:transposase-like protein
MKGSRFSEEQIIGVLREHEAGAKTEEVCRRHGISSATLYKWKSKYGGLEVSEARRLRGPGRASDIRASRPDQRSRHHSDSQCPRTFVDRQTGPTLSTR